MTIRSDNVVASLMDGIKDILRAETNFRTIDITDDFSAEGNEGLFIRPAEDYREVLDRTASDEWVIYRFEIGVRLSQNSKSDEIALKYTTKRLDQVLFSLALFLSYRPNGVYFWHSSLPGGPRRSTRENEEDQQSLWVVDFECTRENLLLECSEAAI